MMSMIAPFLVEISIINQHQNLSVYVEDEWQRNKRRNNSMPLVLDGLWRFIGSDCSGVGMPGN